MAGTLQTSFKAWKSIYDLWLILKVSCDHGSLSWAHLFFFCPYHHGTGLVPTSHLTSAGTPYRKPKANDAKAKILLQLWRKLWQSPRRISHALQMISKGLHACFVYTLNWQGATANRNTDMDPNYNKPPFSSSHPTHGKFFQSPQHMEGTNTQKIYVWETQLVVKLRVNRCPESWHPQAVNLLHWSTPYWHAISAYWPQTAVSQTIYLWYLALMWLWDFGRLAMGWMALTEKGGLLVVWIHVSVFYWQWPCQFNV